MQTVIDEGCQNAGTEAKERLRVNDSDVRLDNQLAEFCMFFLQHEDEFKTVWRIFFLGINMKTRRNFPRSLMSTLTLIYIIFTR